MNITDLTVELFDGSTRNRSPSEINGVTVHRVGIDLEENRMLGNGSDPVLIGKEFISGKAAKYTGSSQPYDFYIGGPNPHDGKIFQARALSNWGWHAKHHSNQTISIACIGDFRVQTMTLLQRWSLIDLSALLLGAHGMNPYAALRGHTELKNATSDKYKECPGDLADMPGLRDEVAAVMQEIPRAKLLEIGLRL